MTYAPIPNFPAYRVSSSGDIETRWRKCNYHNALPLREDEWRPLKCKGRSGDGYRAIDLRDGLGGSRRTYVHILVAEAFHGPKPFPEAVVRHLDGNTNNNKATNLRWGTHLENEQDKHAHGTWMSRYGGGKLTKEQRCNIRLRYSAGESQQKLADEFGVSRPTITRLINNSTWGVDR